MTHVAPSLPSVLFTAPYITVDEYKAAPTGVDISSLVPGATVAQRDAALANLIVRASGLVNNVCGQNLVATLDIEQGRVTMNRKGEIFIQTFCWPIVEVQAVTIGGSPSQMTAADLTNIFIEHSAFTLVQPSLGLSTSVGPLQLGGIAPTGRAYAQWQYVNGWPCTTLKVTALAGATNIQVMDSTGVHIGTKLVMYDQDNTETVTVTAEPLGSQTLSVTALAHPHATVGISVTSLPSSVKEAAIQMTSGLIKLKGNQALVMRSLASTEPEAEDKNQGAGSDIKGAAWMLQPFRVVR